MWLYVRFSLSFRDVEDISAQRRIIVTYETVRQCCLTCGQTDANELRCRRPHGGETWHLDEVVLSSRGNKLSLWRAVDQDGHVLDILAQSHRNTQAAKRFFRKLLKGLHDVPCVIMTDTLKRYGAATREIGPAVEHRQHQRLHPRAENAHHPTRWRENSMRTFPSATHAQCFLSADRASLPSRSPPKAPSRCKGIP